MAKKSATEREVEYHAQMARTWSNSVHVKLARESEKRAEQTQKEKR